MNATAQYPRIPLKRMDAAMLSFELLAELTGEDPGERNMVVSAAQIAALLHEGQTRQARGPLERTPYIEHPIRVALRLRRWGQRSAGLTAAALLHDTIEDCAPLFKQLGAVAADASADSSNYHAAWSWLNNTYGSRVGDTVLSVSNVPPAAPATDTAQATNADKAAAYTAKIAAITQLADDWPVLVKASDIVDNAGSLTHQYGLAPETMVRKLAAKYTPALPLLEDSLRQRGYEGPAQHLARVTKSVALLTERLNAGARATKAAPKRAQKKAQPAEPAEPTTEREPEL